MMPQPHDFSRIYVRSPCGIDQAWRRIRADANDLDLGRLKRCAKRLSMAVQIRASSVNSAVDRHRAR